MTTISLFILGFIILVRGADLFVVGSSVLGKKIGLSDILIGLTIVAFGTSLPELVVNVVSALSGNTDLALGNILGSNIANTFLILGCSALLFPIVVGKMTAYKEIPFNLVAALAVGIMGGSIWLDHSTTHMITRGEGLTLILFFSIFIYYTVEIARNSEASSQDATLPSWSTPRASLMIILGLTGLVIGGQWIVNGAVALAESLGISETIIGLTIVAIGTSLPELATSLAAAWRKKTDIVIGNIIGSNIFNTFWILGITAVITPVVVLDDMRLSLLGNGIAALLILALIFIGKRNVIERWQGGLLVIAYGVFMTLTLLPLI
jgi:cation:H+ antiporter